jgi:hypothetical protein
MRVIKGTVTGFALGAILGGLLLALPTLGSREFAHETTQSSLSMFFLGASFGAVLGSVIGFLVGIVRSVTK